MPRQPRSTAVVKDVPQELPANSLIASQINLGVGGVPTVFRNQDVNWQDRAWEYYNEIGEVSYVAGIIGALLSRATMKCVMVDETGKSTPGTARGQAALGQLFESPEGRAQMLNLLGIHITIAGEAYMVGRNLGNGKQEWLIVGYREIKVTGTGVNAKWSLRDIDGKSWLPLVEGTDVILRIWNPSPTDRMRAHSNMKALLAILAEIKLYTLHIAAQLTSRLTGAGILILPSEMTLPKPPPNPDGSPAVNDELSLPDRVMKTLAKLMMTPIKDPGSAAAVVPIVLTMEGELIQHVRLIHFWTDLDANAIAMRSEAVRRFAVGINIPPEVLLGQGDSSHWNAWAVDESTIKGHLEPLLALMTGAIAIGYLRPASGNDDDTILVDTSALRLRPDHSKEAQELNANGLLSDEATRRENGFSEADAMSEDEFKRFLMKKVALGTSATPDQAAAALKEMGVDFHLPSQDLRNAVVDAEGRLHENIPDAKPDAPSHGAPDPGESEAGGQNPYALLTAVATPVMHRALERAGNKLVTYRGVTDEIKDGPAHLRYQFTQKPTPGRVDEMLKGAWDCVPELLGQYGDTTLITAALDGLARALITEQRPFSKEMLEAAFHMSLGNRRLVAI